MNKKKRGGRDRAPRDRRNIYSDEESVDNEMIDINEIEREAEEMEMAREVSLINSYNAFLGANVGPRVRNIRLYWIDIRNAAYSHLKTYIMNKYDNARREETMDFHDMSVEFIEDIKININDESNTDERGNFAPAYPGELINPINYRDLYDAFETFSTYLYHLKAESDNVEFIETEMRFIIGEGRNSDEILEIINNQRHLFEHIIDETEMMLDYEKNVYIFNPVSLNIANFSDEMSEEGNIIEYLNERHSVIPNYHPEDGQLNKLLLDYYIILENMVASTFDRMYYANYTDGGRKIKKKNKRKVKRKSIKKNKKSKRKTKRKIYGRKR